MNQVEIEFENVTPTKDQINILFELLLERSHRISYEENNFNEHETFVKSHPYRSWFLIKISDNYVGSFYVSKENTIGINIADNYVRLAVAPIINFVESNFEPLSAIPSVRNGKFAVNVSPANKLLAKALEEIGANIAQITYFLPS